MQSDANIVCIQFSVHLAIAQFSNGYEVIRLIIIIIILP